MNAMSLWRLGPVVTRVAEIIFRKPKTAAGYGIGALRQLVYFGGNIENAAVSERAAGRVRVFDNQRITLHAIWGAIPCQGRKKVFALS